MGKKRRACKVVISISSASEVCISKSFTTIDCRSKHGCGDALEKCVAFRHKNDKNRSDRHFLVKKGQHYNVQKYGKHGGAAKVKVAKRQPLLVNGFGIRKLVALRRKKSNIRSAPSRVLMTALLSSFQAHREAAHLPHSLRFPLHQVLAVVLMILRLQERAVQRAPT
jgi:hypothetical protein